MTRPIGDTAYRRPPLWLLRFLILLAFALVSWPLAWAQAAHPGALNGLAIEAWVVAGALATWALWRAGR